MDDRHGADEAGQSHRRLRWAALVSRVMAAPEPGAKVAKDQGLYLGQIYAMVKSGKVTNHKPDGKYVVPDGKGLLVDPDEVAAAKASGRKRGGTGPGKGKSGYVRKADRPVGSEESKTVKTRKLKPGTIVSVNRAMQANGTKVLAPAATIATVLAQTGNLTYLDDGNRRSHYSGMQIDNLVFFSDRLSLLMAKGVAHIERPNAVLGMVILSFILDGKMDLANGLERWMIKNGLDVQIPEIMDVDAIVDDEEAVDA